MLLPFLLCMLAFGGDDLLIEAKYTFTLKSSMGGYRLEERVEGRKKPFTNRGLAYATIDVPLPFYASLSNFETSITGSRTKPQKIDFSPDYEDVFYSDSKVSRHDYRGEIEKGNVIEYEYHRQYNDVPFLPTLTFSKQWNYTPIEITFEHPKSVRVEFDLFFPLEEFTYNIERDTRKTTLTLKPDSETDDPLAYYPFDHARVFVRPRLLKDGEPLCKSTPELFGPWYEAMLQKREGLSPETIAKAKTWLGDAQTPVEKARKLFEHVRDNIDYHASYVAFGAIVPRTGDKVVESGYGDCKDRAFLLRNLGREFGLDIKMVLVHTGEGTPFDSVKVSDFNHVICALKDGDSWVYFDPTLEHYQFAELSANLAEKRALILDGADSKIVQLPAPPSQPMLDIELTVDAANPEQGHAVVRLRQDYLALARMGRLEGDWLDQENLLSNLTNFHLRQISLDYFEPESDEGEYATFRAKADLSKFLVTSSKRLYMPSTPFTLADADLLDRRADDKQLYWRSGTYVTLKINLKHEGWQPPEAKDLSGGDQKNGYLAKLEPGPNQSTAHYDFRRLSTQMSGVSKTAYLDFTENYLLMRKKMFRFRRSAP